MEGRFNNIDEVPYNEPTDSCKVDVLVSSRVFGNKLCRQNYYYYCLRKFLDEQQTLLLNLENEIIEKDESAEWKEVVIQRYRDASSVLDWILSYKRFNNIFLLKIWKNHNLVKNEKKRRLKI